MMGKIDLWIAVLLVGLGAISCEEYQEGCMDAAATNFRVSNQTPCCCEYPNLIFQTTLTADGMPSAFTDTFTNDFGQRFLIRDLRFIASDIVLHDSMDRQYTPTDTFDTYAIDPDVLATDVLNLNSTGGNFMSDGRFDEIAFTIGQVSELDNAEPDDFPLDHPFRDSLFYDFNQRTWYAFRALVEVIDQDPVSIQLTQAELPVPMVISGSWEKQRGGDLTVNFKVNIGKLFGNLDFSMPLADLRQQVGQNLPTSFEP